MVVSCGVRKLVQSKKEDGTAILILDMKRMGMGIARRREGLLVKWMGKTALLS